jgi:hypothetical protein
MKFKRPAISLRRPDCRVPETPAPSIPDWSRDRPGLLATRPVQVSPMLPAAAFTAVSWRGEGCGRSMTRPPRTKYRYDASEKDVTAVCNLRRSVCVPRFSHHRKELPKEVARDSALWEFVPALEPAYRAKVARPVSTSGKVVEVLAPGEISVVRHGPRRNVSPQLVCLRMGRGLALAAPKHREVASCSPYDQKCHHRVTLAGPLKRGAVLTSGASSRDRTSRSRNARTLERGWLGNSTS